MVPNHDHAHFLHNASWSHRLSHDIAAKRRIKKVAGIWTWPELCHFTLTSDWKTVAMPISCHFRDCKALLFESIASTHTFTFTFRPRQLGNYMYIHHRHLFLLLSSKADTHFTVPLRVEGWVDLVAGYIPKWFTCPQTVTHPSINRDWCRITC